MTPPTGRVLLDTNVVSELVRPQPASAVRAYLGSLDQTQTFLSLMTIGELERGIFQAGPERRQKLRNWLEGQLISRYAGRLLPLDEAVIRRWGECMALPAVRARSGMAIDALLAATASVHHLTMVTRNVADFQVFPVALYDPWTFQA